MERKIGVIQPIARALKLQGKLPNAAFAKLMQTANFLQEHFPTVSHDWSSAFAVSERRSFPFAGLRVIGCDDFVHTPGGVKAQTPFVL